MCIKERRPYSNLYPHPHQQAYSTASSSIQSNPLASNTNPTHSYSIPQRKKTKGKKMASKPLLTLLTLLTTSLAATVNVLNNCNRPIYFRPDNQPGNGAKSQILPGATNTTALAGIGNAYKFDYDQNLKSPIEFDYSVSTDGMDYYDVSDVPGHPFDLIAVPSDPNCAAVGCGLGFLCRKIEACEASASMAVTACPA